MNHPLSSRIIEAFAKTEAYRLTQLNAEQEKQLLDYLSKSARNIFANQSDINHFLAMSKFFNEQFALSDMMSDFGLVKINYYAAKYFHNQAVKTWAVSEPKNLYFLCCESASLLYLGSMLDSLKQNWACILPGYDELDEYINTLARGFWAYQKDRTLLSNPNEKTSDFLFNNLIEFTVGMTENSPVKMNVSILLLEIRTYFFSLCHELPSSEDYVRNEAAHSKLENLVGLITQVQEKSEGDRLLTGKKLLFRILYKKALYTVGHIHFNLKLIKKTTPEKKDNYLNGLEQLDEINNEINRTINDFALSFDLNKMGDLLLMNDLLLTWKNINIEIFIIYLKRGETEKAINNQSSFEAKYFELSKYFRKETLEYILRLSEMTPILLDVIFDYAEQPVHNNKMKEKILNKAKEMIDVFLRVLLDQIAYLVTEPASVRMRELEKLQPDLMKLLFDIYRFGENVVNSKVRASYLEKMRPHMTLFKNLESVLWEEHLRTGLKDDGESFFTEQTDTGLLLNHELNVSHELRTTSLQSIKELMDHPRRAIPSSYNQVFVEIIRLNSGFFNRRRIVKTTDKWIVYKFIITLNDIKFGFISRFGTIKLFKDPAEEQEYLDAFRYHVGYQAGGTSTDPSITLTLKDLYQTLWKPIEERIKKYTNINRVYINPDGIYHQLNINAFIDENGKYLIDKKKYSLYYVKSFDNLALKPRHSNVCCFAAVNPDFNAESVGKGDRQFSDKVSELWQSAGVLHPLPSKPGIFPKNKSLQYQIIEGRDFNRDKFLNLLKVAQEERTPDVMIINTHGFSWGAPDIPSGYRVGLSLAGFNNGTEKQAISDVLLTPQDIVNYDLGQIRLVLLLACFSGVGDYKDFNGIQGFVKAFQMAGVAHVLYTLTKVNSSSNNKLIEYLLTDMADVKQNMNSLPDLILSCLKRIKSEADDNIYSSGRDRKIMQWGGYGLMIS